MKQTVYTIGYTAFEINKFIEVLKIFNINCLVDVRSTPRSSYYTDFDDYNLRNTLKNHQIVYRNYKEEFGARQDNKDFYSKEGYLDFEKFAKSEQFNRGIDKIKKAYEMNFNVCLMCAEKDPFNCHRTILVSKNLKENGFDVQHILADETTCSQDDIEHRLLEKYFPHREQISFFSEDNLSDEEAIQKAYKLRNEEIGFKLGDEE